MNQTVVELPGDLPVAHPGQEQMTAVRAILGASMGKVIDPELATSIEMAALRSTPHRRRVDRLVASMEQLPQVDVQYRHHFLPGVYMREALIGKDVAAAGAEHKVENLIVISKGRLLVATEDGHVELAAGDVLRCMPGMVNAVHALEDSHFSNIWANPDNETDMEILIPRYFHAEASELVGGSKNRQLQIGGRMQSIGGQL